MRLTWHRNWGWRRRRCWRNWRWRWCGSRRRWWDWCGCWRRRRILRRPATLSSHALHSLSALPTNAALHLTLVVKSVTLSMASMCSFREICWALGIRNCTFCSTNDTLVTNTVRCLTFLARRLSIMASWNRSWCRRCWCGRRRRYWCWHWHGRRSWCWSWWSRRGWPPFTVG